MIADGANRALAPALQETSAQSLQRFLHGAVVRCQALYSKMATAGVRKENSKQYVTDHVRATNQGSWVRILPGAPEENKGLQSMQALIFDSVVNNQGVVTPSVRTHTPSPDQSS